MNSSIQTFVKGDANAMNTKTAQSFKRCGLSNFQQAAEYLYKMRNEYNQTNQVNFGILKDCPNHIKTIIESIANDSMNTKYETVTIDYTLRDAWGKSAEELEEECDSSDDEVQPAPTLKLQKSVLPKPKLIHSSKYNWMSNIPQQKSKIDRTQFPKPQASLNKKLRTTQTIEPQKELTIEPTKTKMCFSILNNKTCTHGDSCKFAHTLDELKCIECHFGNRCNKKTSCTFFHPERESREAYLKRMYPQL